MWRAPLFERRFLRWALATSAPKFVCVHSLFADPWNLSAVKVLAIVVTTHKFGRSQSLQVLPPDQGQCLWALWPMLQLACAA